MIKQLHFRFLLLAILIFTATFSSLAQKTKNQNIQSAEQSSNIVNAKEEINRVEREYSDAFVQPTIEAVKRFHTDDFATTSMVPARVTTKAQILAELEAFAGRRSFVGSMVTEDLEIRFYGETAVTTGVWKRISQNSSGIDTSGKERFTRVWVKRDDSWQLAASHYSPVFDLPKR